MNFHSDFSKTETDREKESERERKRKWQPCRDRPGGVATIWGGSWKDLFSRFRPSPVCLRQSRSILVTLSTSTHVHHDKRFMPAQVAAAEAARHSVCYFLLCLSFITCVQPLKHSTKPTGSWIQCRAIFTNFFFQNIEFPKQSATICTGAWEELPPKCFSVGRTWHISYASCSIWLSSFHMKSILCLSCVACVSSVHIFSTQYKPPPPLKQIFKLSLLN